MRKGGEITSQQIVVLIVAIASFAVILFFMFKLNLGQTTNEELCHNSVITRGSAVVSAEALPLKCHRKYLCINNGGDCEGLTNPEIESVESLEEVYGILAEEMVNCWWMFGEGRVNYVGGDLIQDNYCSICSQIYFDESLNEIKEVEGFIDQNDFYKFLEKTKFDDTNTYAQYLFGGESVDNLKKELLEKDGVGVFGNIEIGKHYFVTTGIISESDWKHWLGAGAGGSVGLRTIGSFLIKITPLSTNPVGWIAGGFIIAGTAVGGVVAENYEPSIAAIILDGRGIDNRFMAPTIIESDPTKFEALNCEEILTLA